MVVWNGDVHLLKKTIFYDTATNSDRLELQIKSNIGQFILVVSIGF